CAFALPGHKVHQGPAETGELQYAGAAVVRHGTLIAAVITGLRDRGAEPTPHRSFGHTERRSVRPFSRETVAGAVVGQHPSHRDPGGGEERVRALPERRSSLLALIGQQLTVGEARAVIDVVVAVPVAPAGAVLRAGLAAQLLVAPAVGDAPELLDVHMHKVTGSGVHAAAPLPAPSPHGSSGGGVGEGQ